MNEAEQVVHIIIPSDQALAILQSVEAIYLRVCTCRVREQNCPQDEWEVCLLFEHAPQNDLDESKKISLAEAQAHLQTMAESNVVYTLFFTEQNHELTELCSCCTCCCSPLNRMMQEKNYSTYLRSNFVAVTDEALCVGCGLCEFSCPFGARWVEFGLLKFVDERCFGCGRCIQECSEDAISLEYQLGRGVPIPGVQT